MTLRELVTTSLLLAIGFILHAVSPPFFLGMRPDFLLAMLFIVILMLRRIGPSLLAGLVAGILTALTTTFPGGQVANMVDKILTTFFVLLLVKALATRVNDKILAGILAAVGTVFSGAVFLGTAYLVAGLPGSFLALILTVVLPAAGVNTVVTLILYPIVLFSERVVTGSRPNSKPASSKVA